MDWYWVFFLIYTVSFVVSGYLIRCLVEMIQDYRNAKFVRKFHTGYNDHPRKEKL